MELEPIERSSLKDEAYRRIKALILSGRWVVGENLEIDRLAAELNISRTPIREAILMLEREGLVESIPYRGTFIASLSRRDISQIYQVRKALEPLALELAALKIPDRELQEMRTRFVGIRDELEAGNFENYYQSDTDFHDLILRHCGNPILQQLLESLNDRVYRVRSFSRNRPGHQLMESFQEHSLILDALIDRDVTRAKDLMANHMENAGARIAALVPDDS